MEEFPIGTIEYFVVDVTDRLDEINDLTGFTVEFDVRDSDGVFKYQEQPAVPDMMLIKCLLNTTGWNPGKYRLWTTIFATPESPRLGPFYFRMIN